MTTHVQMISAVNADSIKKETIDGEDHYRIPSATLPDNVVMNGGFYPADEIAKSYSSLEGTPAPLGHPKIDGKFVPAGTQRAMNKYSVGAWNENVRRENGRVLLDKVVNIRVANQTPQGKALIKAIEKRDPIHTSTGIMLEREPATNADDGYQWVARNMRFDHDAILLGQVGAATPEQGVGMFVNAAGEESDVLIGNASLTDDEQDTINFSVEQIARQIEKAEKRDDPNSVASRLLSVIKSVLGGGDTPESLAANQKAPEGNSMTKEELETVLNAALDPIKTELAEVKAVNAELKANQDASKAAEAERVANERKPFEERAKAKGLTDEQIKGMETNTLKAAFPEEKKEGYHLDTGFSANSGKTEYELPEE